MAARSLAGIRYCGDEKCLARRRSCHLVFVSRTGDGVVSLLLVNGDLGQPGSDGQ